MTKKFRFIILVVCSVICVMVSGCQNSNNISAKLSVIVPVYNVQDYISTCLDSLTKQTYSNIEIICINDGSTDNSLKILNEYQQKDSRIIVKDKPNGGVSSARNMGIEISSGDYITFVDSDDFINKNTYSVCMKKIQKYGADMLAFGYVLEPKHSVNRPYKNNKIYDSFECLKNEIGINCTIWNKIFKRSLLFDNDNIRFAEDVHYGEDDLFLKLVTPKANKVVGCSGAYYHYVCRESSAESTFSNEKRLIASIKRCKHLIDYYTEKNSYEKYNWIFNESIAITFPRIQSLDDEQKKKSYSIETLNVLEKILNRMDHIESEDCKSKVEQLRLYSELDI